MIRCGDFTAHSSRSDQNGTIIETIMENENLVYLNDVSGTRVHVRTGVLVGFSSAN